MFIFSGVLLIYAALLALTKDYRMLPYRARVSVKPKDPKGYTVKLAKSIAMAAASIALGAAAALWNGAVGAVVMVVGIIAVLWYSAKKEQ